METAWVTTHHLSPPPALLAAIAGVFEIAIAAAVAMYGRTPWPVSLAAGLLALLLVDALMFTPALPIQAFNPVTTNTAALALCYAIYASQPAMR
ncbi:DoxX family protein [Salinisphaera dokdonensis CL-ES53]|uniref:DoxX family protein n=1 Tax=Salinisphaera dokdonensis CL-ES53 TaxID=1304272 RepID=A0ABV2B370_9GAMM